MKYRGKCLQLVMVTGLFLTLLTGPAWAENIVKPDLSSAWSSTYGAIYWGKGWYGVTTKTIMGQLADENGKYVFRGSWGRTNNKRTGQVVFVFDSSTAFSGYWTEGKANKRTTWTGSGSCR